MNVEKTEETSLKREPDKKLETWRKTKKLGTLLGDTEEFMRRKILATQAQKKMKNLCRRKHKVSEKIRLMLYNAFVMPILTYNCET